MKNTHRVLCINISANRTGTDHWSDIVQWLISLTKSIVTWRCGYECSRPRLFLILLLDAKLAIRTDFVRRNNRPQLIRRLCSDRSISWVLNWQEITYKITKWWVCPQENQRKKKYIENRSKRRTPSIQNSYLVKVAGKNGIKVIWHRLEKAFFVFHQRFDSFAQNKEKSVFDSSVCDFQSV